ncbi:MAG: CRISPR-associated protein Cas4 [Prolixibacteraceae bacterium]|nr:CRISPR-associated protein Cas4 [Prolixibacteraceae bacterium]
MSIYSNNDLLMLSGIQHIAFCERQWALIHIEQQWHENVLTVEGKQLHSRVDDPLIKTKSGHSTMHRSVPLVSFRLGLAGCADVVEFLQTDSKQNSISLPGKDGLWQPLPIEYKRGKPKPDDRDEVQLCAQAMCLEELYAIRISEGFLYYGEIRHRLEICFDEKLRSRVTSLAERMHELYTNGVSPQPVYKPHCRSCSLFDICLPVRLSRPERATDYLNDVLEI